jgi:hypothetical protein
MPVDWIKRLFDTPDLISLKTSEQPFWALPNNEHPYFMQVVVPYQNKEWQQLKKIAGLWTIEQPKLADAWYFLGTAEFESHQIAEAKQHLNKCMALNNRHLDAMLTLSKIALLEKNPVDLEQIIRLIMPLDEAEAEKLSMKFLALKSE